MTQGCPGACGHVWARGLRPEWAPLDNMREAMVEHLHQLLLLPRTHMRRLFSVVEGQSKIQTSTVWKTTQTQ